MKTVVLLYETCCIYEIVITNYFLQLCGHELVFATIDGIQWARCQDQEGRNLSWTVTDINKQMEWSVVVAIPVGRVGNCCGYVACGQAVEKLWAACCPYFLHGLSIGGMAVIHAVHRDLQSSHYSACHIQINWFGRACYEASIKHVCWFFICKSLMRALIVVLPDVVADCFSDTVNYRWIQKRGWFLL